MPAFVRLTLTDRLRCEGTQIVYGGLYPEDLISASDAPAVDDVESMTFQFPRLNADGNERDITMEIRAGRVITVTYDDGEFDEWRVGPITKGRGENGVISVTCVSLWLDLVERSDSSVGKGWVSVVTAGVRGFEQEIVDSTAAEIWDDFIIPNAPAWVSAGTVEPTYVFAALSVSRLTPGGLAVLVRDTLRGVDIPCDVRLRRNGTTDYKLDLVTEAGSDAPIPVLHPDNALLTLQEKADPTTQATRVLVKGGTAPDGLPGQWGVARWCGGAPVGLVIALTDRNGGASPIGFDGQFVGNYLLRVKTGRTFLITDSDATAGTVTLSSVSTIAADEDFEFRLDEPLTNTRTTTTRYAVSAVPDGTHLTLGVSAPITVNDQYVDWYAKVWSLAAGGTVIATTRISGSVAATDVLAVASSAGVTNAHYVEFVQLDGAGEIPCYIDHPDYSLPDPVGYGIKVAELSKKQDGITQLTPNGWLRLWSNPSNPPDGWSETGSTQAISQNTDPAFTRYGTHSWAFTHVVNVLDDAVFITPPVYPNWTESLTQLSCRAWVYFETYLSAFGAFYSHLSVYARTASGGLGALLGQACIMPQGSTAGCTVVREDVWVELKIIGMTLGPDTAPYGVVGVWTVRDAAGGLGANDMQVSGYLDVIEFFQFGDAPAEDLEFGDATALLQAGNNHLRTYASPPLFYTFTVLDLARAFPDEYGRLALTVGGTVRAVDTDYGVDAMVRLLKLDRDLLNPANTRLSLGNRPTRLSSLQSKSAVRTRRVIEAVNSGATGGPFTPSFVQLSADIDLPTKAEVSVPSATPYSVTLPPVTVVAGVEVDGASVTFVPPDPTVAPTTVVTVGRPPSRQKPQITDEYF